MKKYVLIIVIAFASCNSNKPNLKINPKNNNIPLEAKSVIKPQPPIYHIKVKYYYNCFWEVVFTNDNFQSEQPLNECWDISSDYIGTEMHHQLKLFQNEKSAINFAKRFKTYKQCVSYNDSVKVKYDQMVKYRKTHPVKEPKYDAVSCCKNDVGKEDLIH